MQKSKPCLSCGGTEWRPLPHWENASMLSDGQLVRYELKKEHCKSCQLLRHVSPPTQSDLDDIFKRGYTLYARAPGDDFEMRRQHRYVGWVLSMVDQQPECSLFELGAGNGSFLLQLQKLAPTWKLAGLEPSAVAAEFARHAGFDIQIATLAELNTPKSQADIVLAINVLEHAEDPVAFLRHSALLMKNAGCIVIICPDGERPSSELLVYDHIHSFTTRSIHNIARAAGLIVESRSVAPEPLGPFQAFKLRGAHDKPSAVSLISSPDDLYERRDCFLTSWHNLDDALFQRAHRFGEEIWAFGCGENAQLLRTYAPKTWGLVTGVTADVKGDFDGTPINQYQPALKDRSRTLLLAVRPEVQGDVAKRLQDDGHRVIQWDDLMQNI